MRVKDIMTSKVETVDQEEIAEAAYNLMRLKKIHHLVVTGMGELVGILSERDLGGRDRETKRQLQKVVAFMTPYAVRARPGMTVREAANLMRGWTIGCLPVVDKGRLVGIVTVSDLLELVARGGEPSLRSPGARRPTVRSDRTARATT